MSIARPLVRFAPALVLLATLAGCSTTSIAVDPLTLPAGAVQSPVAVSITANTAKSGVSPR